MKTNPQISSKAKWIQIIYHGYGNSLACSLDFFLSFLEILTLFMMYAAKPFSYKHSTCKQERRSYTWFYIRGWAKKTLFPVIVNLSFIDSN